MNSVLDRQVRAKEKHSRITRASAAGSLGRECHGEKKVEDKGVWEGDGERERLRLTEGGRVEDKAGMRVCRD